MIPPLCVESVFRDLRPCVFAVADHLPKSLDVGSVAWKPASHADDCNGIVNAAVCRCTFNTHDVGKAVTG